MFGLPTSTKEMLKNMGRRLNVQAVVLREAEANTVPSAANCAYPDPKHSHRRRTPEKGDPKLHANGGQEEPQRRRWKPKKRPRPRTMTEVPQAAPRQAG